MGGVGEERWVGGMGKEGTILKLTIFLSFWASFRNIKLIIAAVSAISVSETGIWIYIQILFFITSITN